MPAMRIGNSLQLASIDLPETGDEGSPHRYRSARRATPCSSQSERRGIRIRKPGTLIPSLTTSGSTAGAKAS